MSELRTDTITGSDGTSPVTLTKQSAAKAWAHIASGGASLPDSLNFSSIDDDGTGEYGLNYVSVMGSVNYSANAALTFAHTSGANNIRVVYVESKATGSVEIDSGYSASSVYTAYDIETDASVIVQGDLA